MAIKIPRGEIPAPSVGNRGSSVLSAVQSNKIDYDKVTDTIDFIGNKIAAHNAKIEAQRIDNKNTLNKALLQGDVNSLLENINDNPKLSTDGTLESYNGVYNVGVKKLEEKYKKIYKNDDDAFAIWKSDLYTVVNNGSQTMRTSRRKKVLAEAQINFNSTNVEFTTNLDNQPVTPNIWMSTELLIKQEKERFIRADALGIPVNYESHLKMINDKTWKKVISANKNYVDDLTGLEEVDYKAIYNELNSTKSTQEYFGKTMPKDTKESLLSWAKEKSTTQQAMYDSRKEAKQLVSNETFTNQLIAISSNSIKGIEYSKDFLKNLEADVSLSPELKRTLKTAYNTTLKNLVSGAATYESPTGLQVKATLTYLVNGGFIDTKGEYAIINNAMAEGHIKPEYATTLLKNAKENTKERHQWKKTVTKNAISVLAKELNVDDLNIAAMVENFDSSKAGSAADILSKFLSDSKMPKEVYAAMNQMFAMVAEGEGKNISIKEMLMDEKSPNYILNDLIGVYKARVKKEVDKNWMGILSADEQLAVSSITKNGFDYSFDTTKYFSGKSSDTPAVDLPLKNEGESVFSYIERVQKVTKTNKDKYLPEWGTGNFVTDSLDMSSFIITPEGK
jgi:hypothetical protein